MGFFQVRVTALPAEDIPLIRSLRVVVGQLDLSEAKGLSVYLHAHLPCVLVGGIDRDVAEHACSLLEEAGASAEVEPSNLVHPFILCPEANQRRVWTRWATIKRA